MNLIDVSIRRPVFISTLLLTLLVFGVESFFRLGVDMFPKIEAPVATVLTVYPGADPETVEQDVTEKIEDALSELSGIDELKSVSVENVSQVVVVFDMDMDADQAVANVRDKVSRIAGTLPEDAHVPTVEQLDLDAAPILTLALSAPDRLDRITRFAQDYVKQPLQAVPGVGSVDVAGGVDPEIKVLVDPQKLAAANLAVTDVVQALAANNLEFPGGTVTAGSKELAVRVEGEMDSPEALARLPIVDVAGHVVRVGDVAQVSWGLSEQRSAASRNGEDTVALLVRKQSGANALRTADAVEAKLRDIRGKLPQGWSLDIVSNQTMVTRASFHAVWFDLVFGGVLAVIIVLIFLRNWRATVVSALALPLSVVGTFAFMRAMGFTFNTMTLLALTLSIGLLIDDAIVVIENIYRHKERGKSAFAAAAEGTKEIVLAVLATTLSLVAVFLPSAVTGGMIGKMFFEFGMTVSAAVLISLFVSFTLTPMLSARLLADERENRLSAWIGRGLDALDRGYHRVIGWALSHRAAVVVVALAVFALTIWAAGFMTSEFTPSYDTGLLDVQVEMPSGTSLEATRETAEQVAARIRAFPEVDQAVVTVGADAQQRQNVAAIQVVLVDKHRRARTHLDMIDAIRKAVAGTPDAEISVQQPAIGGSKVMAGAALQFRLRGDNLDALEKAATSLTDAMLRSPSLTDVSMSFKGGKPQLAVRVDHEKAMAAGVPTAVLGQTVRALFEGVTAGSVTWRGADRDVRVRLNPEFRDRIDQFGTLRVRGAGGALVPLSNIAQVRYDQGPAQIDRGERRREIVVFANPAPGVALSDAQQVVESLAADLPADIDVSWGGQVKMMRETQSEFAVTLLLSVILVYLVLAAQFESWLHPVVIMMSLPLSVIGALAAIGATGQAVSMITLIGMLMLMGLVTKNAILLVDYTNVLRRRDGMALREALMRAGATRLRPILMTTLAMVFGMVPVAVSSDWGAELRAPMAVAVIGGLAASTLLTLVVVPVVYAIAEGVKGRLARGGKEVVA